VDDLRSLWDQLDALRYVHENIEYYGGDPKRVTVGGHDASACTLDLISLVALNRENKFDDGLPLYDLFQRVILQRWEPFFK
jgi:carboxylesterase type B